MLHKMLRACFWAIAISIIPFSSAYADTNDFTVKQFTADYYLSRDDPQGKMHVVEKIYVQFTDQNHCLLRALPLTYGAHRLGLKVNSVSSESNAPAQYSTYESDGNLIVKIGDPNHTVTGDQQYTIDYTEQNVISFFNDHDELYWNINGDQWSQLFDAVNATIHLPSGVSLSRQPVCYTGRSGSLDQACQVISMQNRSVTASAQNLGRGDTLTVVIGFQKGFFQPYTWRDYVAEYASLAVAFFLPLFAVGGGGLAIWLKRGRDAKGKGTIVPEYVPPAGLRPLEAGVVLNFKANGRDFTATIIDLAVRGYLRIIEHDNKGILGKSRKFSLQVVNHDWQELAAWEVDLLRGLENEANSSGEADLSKPMRSMQPVISGIRKDVDRSLVYRGLLRTNPYYLLSAPFIAIILATFLFGLTGKLDFWSIGSMVRLGLIMGGVIAAVFVHFMPARISAGVAAKEQLLGLKLYLNVAEKHRLAALQSPDSPYAVRSQEPDHTVELFERLLPFAISLKVEKAWAKKFNDMYTSPPDWYSGNYSTFSAGSLAGSLGTSFNSVVGSSFASPHSSGGSGFGGGAGGGGGGGGSGW